MWRQKNKITTASICPAAGRILTDLFLARKTDFKALFIKLHRSKCDSGQTITTFWKERGPLNPRFFVPERLKKGSKYSPPKRPRSL